MLAMVDHDKGLADQCLKPFLKCSYEHSGLNNCKMEKVWNHQDHQPK